MKFTLSIIASLITLTIVSAAERPNIVFVMTDDQDYGDFGANGNKLIKPPNLNAMAASSVSWNEFHVSPVRHARQLNECYYTNRSRFCISAFSKSNVLEGHNVQRPRL